MSANIEYRTQNNKAFLGMKATENQVSNYRKHLANLDGVKELLETLAANNQAAEEVLRNGGTEADYSKRAFCVEPTEVIDAIRDIMLLKYELNGDIEGMEYEIAHAN